jgi:tetratricopeptide (TPR) repeat protein
LSQLEHALAIAEALDLREVFVEALISKGTALGREGRREEAEILLGAALERAVAQDLLTAGHRAANNLAAFLEARDAFAESVLVSQRGIEIARRIGDRRTEEFMRAGKVTTDVALGRWNEALAIADDIDPTAPYGVQAAYVVEIECRRGRVAEARQRLGRHTPAHEVDDPQIRAMYSLAEAIVLRAEGNARHAFETAERALEQALSRVGIGFIGAKVLLVEALEGAFELNVVPKLEELLGLIEALRSGERSPMLAAYAARFRAKLERDLAPAEAGFRRAAEGFRECGLVFPLAVAQLEHAERLAAEGRSADAQALLEEARETFERLEASPWVERTRTAQREERPHADLIER